MHDIGHLGLVHWDDPEGWYRERGGREVQYGEQCGDSLKKNLEIEQPYDSAIPLLGIHTEETRIERDMCTPMFIAALFIIART